MIQKVYKWLIQESFGIITTKLLLRSMKLKVPEKLTEQEIKEFQEIYKRIHGKAISTDDAKTEITTMLSFIASVIEQ